MTDTYIGRTVDDKDNDPLFQARTGVFVSARSISKTIDELNHKLLGIQKWGRCYTCKNVNGFLEVCNKKLELLGVVYYWKPWKKYVWEQIHIELLLALKNTM